MSSLMMNRMLGLSIFAMLLPFQEFVLSITSRAIRRDSPAFRGLGSVPKAPAGRQVERQLVSPVSFVARGSGGGHRATAEQGNPDTSGRTSGATACVTAVPGHLARRRQSVRPRRRAARDGGTRNGIAEATAGSE